LLRAVTGFGTKMACVEFIVEGDRAFGRGAMQRSGVGVLGAAALALLWVAGCGETTEERAASGGLGGAAAGAVVGGPVGAVVGGAAGATGGTVLEKSTDEKTDEATDETTD
jgi:hypothetical protein